MKDVSGVTVTTGEDITAATVWCIDAGIISWTGRDIACQKPHPSRAPWPDALVPSSADNRAVNWTVADVMTRDVIVVRPDTDFKTCVRRIQEGRVGAMPVVDEDQKLVGIVSESDLLAKERRRGERRPPLRLRWEEDDQAAARTAGEVMTSPAICIAPDASLPQAARLMRREAVKRLPVVDRNGVVVGIVSERDLLKTFVRSDDAIRRDIVGDVITRTLFLDPNSVDVDVTNGVVRLSGEVETRSLARILTDMVLRVEGTIAVDSKVRWRLDDSKLRIEKPARSLQLAADER